MEAMAWGGTDISFDQPMNCIGLTNSATLSSKHFCKRGSKAGSSGSSLSELISRRRGPQIQDQVDLVRATVNLESRRRSQRASIQFNWKVEKQRLSLVLEAEKIAPQEPTPAICNYRAPVSAMIAETWTKDPRRNIVEPLWRLMRFEESDPISPADALRAFAFD